MASPAPLVAEGEAYESRNKANTINQPKKGDINSPSSEFGFDGTSDPKPRRGRIPSRSPSPYRRHYRRSPSHSPAPYRHKTSQRSPSRSPEPYRHNRPRDHDRRDHHDRSPSPYRHGRADRTSPRSQHKRKASPPHNNYRSDKRHAADRNRYNGGHNGYNGGYNGGHNSGGGRQPSSHNNGPRTDPPQYGRSRESQTTDRFGRRISYGELDGPKAVPHFQESLPIGGPSQKPAPERTTKSAPKAQRTNATQDERAEQRKDIEMSNATDEPEPNLEIAIKPVDKAPDEDEREKKRARWAARRAAAELKSKEKDSLLQQAVVNASEANTPNAASPANAPSPVDATSPADAPSPANAASPANASSPADMAGSPFASPRVDLDSIPASPDVMLLDKQAVISEDNSPSAADYDPTQDMLDDQNRALALKKTQNGEVSSAAYNETDPEVLSTLPAEKVAPVEAEKEYDMFDFTTDQEEEFKPKTEGETKGTVLDEKLLRNWDDHEQYYRIINNELMNKERYRVIKFLGRGVFANVAQAEETYTENEKPKKRLVAIKIVRRSDFMRTASAKEMSFLRKANELDPDDSRHIVRLLGSFDHKGHLCIVFEHMSMNLRDLLKAETNGHGLALPAVRAYAKQMFLGLRHLKNCHIMHLDLKPDNVLVSVDKKTVKLADFGTAVDRRDPIDRTAYLVSRFYRAPEIILGMDLNHAADMWAIGCTVYELWTGKILFTGRSNNQMIRSFMDCLGWPSEKLLRKGNWMAVGTHFEEGPPLKFISVEYDDEKPFVRKIPQQKKINRDMKTRVYDAAKGIVAGGPTPTELNDLTDLLSQTLHMNVDKRITPEDALTHKFFPTRPVQSKSAALKPGVKKPVLPKSVMPKSVLPKSAVPKRGGGAGGMRGAGAGGARR